MNVILSIRYFVITGLVILFLPFSVLGQVKSGTFTSKRVQSTKLIPDDPTPPSNPIRLVFIHHSTGGNWLADENGGLGIALKNNNYYVSDVSYGWGPNSIGDRTDIGNWWEWFRDSVNSQIYLDSVFRESGKNSPFGDYTRLDVNPNPSGENEIILFKSCFPNSALQGNISDPIPPINDNPLRGESSGSEYHTIANAKGIYNDILEYFRRMPRKLFIVITAPPLSDSTYSSNARAFNMWLVNDWLKSYSGKNVFVFDFYNVLTTNAGSPDSNDLNRESGNHHRWKNGAIQHKTDGGNNTLAYPSEDDHPNQQGNFKATAEFLPLLNVAYNRWKSNPVVTTSYKISGVINSSGLGLSSVSVRLLGNGKDTISITNSNGMYEFPNIISGSYTIIPSKANYSFNPPSYMINSLSKDTTLNFTASLVTGVQFSDAALEAEIRKSISKLTGTITETDMAALTNFTADHKNITDLTGLEKAVNLTTLDLNSNKITSILPLAGLTKLLRLTLYGNLITNINPLEKLTSIHTLLIGYNPISDISVLSKLTNLAILDIPSIQASSFSAISNLTHITELQIQGNHISSLSFMDNMNNIAEIYLHDNQIADMSPLANKTQLVSLVIYNNKIKDITPLVNLKNLMVIYLGSNLVSDLSPLSGLNKLTQLFLQGNSINNLKPISGLSALTDLDISNNKLSDVSLPDLYQLKSLTNKNIYTNITGEYKTGYLDLRGNIGFSENGIKALDSQLPLLAYDHILWNTVSTFYNITGIIRTGGAALSDVSVKLTGRTKDTTVISNSTGTFRFSNIPAGDIYILKPSKSGFSFFPDADTLGVLLGDSSVTFVAAKTNVIEEPSLEPLHTDLYQNYPNPFNPETEIKFSLANSVDVDITIFDSFGRKIETIIDQRMAPGLHSIKWVPNNLASGVYYCKLIAGEFRKTMKMMFVR